MEKFLVSGASKRGWTTWLVGGVLGSLPNSRVVGIAPIVMDMLDFQPNVLHMYKAYGASLRRGRRAVVLLAPARPRRVRMVSR